jgi:hypothetical protein
MGLVKVGGVLLGWYELPDTETNRKDGVDEQPSFLRL